MIQYDYIKESTYSFVLDEKITPTKAKAFITMLIHEIGMELVHLQENVLEPGFDICATIKQSIVYFGYWYEHDYVRLIVSSCKTYESKLIIDSINKFFDVKSKVSCCIAKDCTITKEVKALC